MRLPFAILLLLLAIPAVRAAQPASTPPTEPTSGFTNPAEDARYHALLKNLRCLVCQDESLQASQAGLARDLRRQVRDQMRQGKSNPDIIKYLVARYGDFVLYRPPLMHSTYVLWFGPFVALLIGLGVAVVLVRRRAAAREAEPLSDDARTRLADLLRDHEEPKA